MDIYFMPCPLTLDDFERSNSQKIVLIVCIIMKRLLKALVTLNFTSMTFDLQGQTIGFSQISRKILEIRTWAALRAYKKSYICFILCHDLWPWMALKGHIQEINHFNGLYLQEKVIESFIYVNNLLIPYFIFRIWPLNLQGHSKGFFYKYLKKK